MIPLESKHKLESLDALVLCAERNLIDMDAFHKGVEVVMGHGVFSHMLGKTGLTELRKELQDLPFMNPWEVLEKIRGGTHGVIIVSKGKQ